MSFEAFSDEGALLRHHSHITRAVHHGGLFPVLRVVIAAWWTRPRLPQGLSARLRADMGFPPERRSVFWPEPSDNPQVPLPMWWQAM